MNEQTLEKVLATLSVEVHAFALCQISRGLRLTIEPAPELQLHYILAGSGDLRTGTGREFHFSRGSVVIVPSGVSQSIGREDVGAGSPNDSRATVREDGLAVVSAGSGDPDIQFACGKLSTRWAGGLGFFEYLTEPMVEDLQEYEHMDSVFALLLNEVAKPVIGSQPLVEALMKQCLILILRRHLQRLGVNSPLFLHLQDSRLARVIAHVLECPSAQHTVAGLAALASMSRSAFAQRFSEIFAQTPIEFVQSVRLELGASLLATTDFPVKLIAGKVGYASRTHFTKAFQRNYGVDPSAYRVNAECGAGVGRQHMPPGVG